MIFTTTETMQKIRENIRAGADVYTAAAAWLRAKADEAAAAPTACVTDQPSPAVSGDPHDYFSEGPYWWPDPKNPEGPYIRRDGYVNPDRFAYHYDALQAICREPYMLAMAAYHLDEPRYAESAREKLRRFFIDPATRMNPHLEYAQAIRGICPGRGIGIIDATGITRLIFSVEILELLNPGDSVAAGVKEWLSAFYHWLRTSKHGIEERAHGNNHSTYCTVLTAALACLLGDAAGFAEDCEHCTSMLKKQMAEDGSFPLEIARTNSIGYSCMNLGGFALLCEIAHSGGVDLWNRDCGGASMSRAVKFMTPYILDADTWPYPTIQKAAEAPNGKTSLYKNGSVALATLTASVRLQDESARAAAKEAYAAAIAENPICEIHPFGPAALWFAQ